MIYNMLLFKVKNPIAVVQANASTMLADAHEEDWMEEEKTAKKKQTEGGVAPGSFTVYLDKKNQWDDVNSCPQNVIIHLNGKPLDHLKLFDRPIRARMVLDVDRVFGTTNHEYSIMFRLRYLNVYEIGAANSAAERAH